MSRLLFGGLYSSFFLICVFVKMIVIELVYFLEIRVLDASHGGWHFGAKAVLRSYVFVWRGIYFRNGFGSFCV